MDGYRIHQSGKHINGTFMRVYVPDAAIQSNGQRLKAIMYLHGFALCMPSFYEKHLETLAKEQGYVVFFPDFQRSLYPNTQPEESDPEQPEINNFQTWLSVATQKPGEGRSFLGADDIHPIFADISESDGAELGGGLSESKWVARRVAWSLVLIIGALNILGWVFKEYAKNLITLISTVGLSLFHRPTEWLDDAIDLTDKAWADLGNEFYPHWAEDDVDAFAFGHSLGGLIALSLPSEFEKRPPEKQRFAPQQIVTADPAPSTEMGIPGFAIALLKLFNAPFTAEPIEIENTGPSLTNPVAILHGGSDEIVKPDDWVKPPAGKLDSNYDCIASPGKAIYFSYSNPDANLVAFHNQAVTDTSYYGDGLFKHFGGVKKGPNNYNFHYVWPGADKIFKGDATPQNLREHLETSDFQIGTEPPSEEKSFFAQFQRIAIFLGIAFLGLGYILSVLPEVAQPLDAERTCITGGWKLALILTHILTFVLIPLAMRVFYQALTILQAPKSAIFASQLGLSFIMVSIASEIGWHVTQCWYYQNDFTMLNFMFYFFLISAFALWADGLARENTQITKVLNIVFAVGLLIVSILYPLGNIVQNSAYKVPIYIVLTVIFAVLTYRGYHLLNKDWRIIFFPIFSVGVNLFFVALLDKYGGNPYTNPQIMNNALFHILHDFAGTLAGVAIFTWLVYEKSQQVIQARREQLPG